MIRKNYLGKKSLQYDIKQIKLIVHTLDEQLVYHVELLKVSEEWKRSMFGSKYIQTVWMWEKKAISDCSHRSLNSFKPDECDILFVGMDVCTNLSICFFIEEHRGIERF